MKLPAAAPPSKTLAVLVNGTVAWLVFSWVRHFLPWPVALLLLLPSMILLYQFSSVCLWILVRRICECEASATPLIMAFCYPVGLLVILALSTVPGRSLLLALWGLGLAFWAWQRLKHSRPV